MKKLRFAGLVDAGILVVAVIAARVAYAQEAPRLEPPRVAPPARAVPPGAPDAGPARPSLTPPMAPPAVHADGRIALQLKDGSRLVGKLVGLDKLKFKASFGEVDVPLDSILGFKLNEQPGRPAESTATVLFKNGDVLTAEPILANIKLEASWGDTTIAGKHVESLVTHTDRVAWQWDGKWRIAPEGPAGGWRTGTPGGPISPYGPPPGSFGPPATTFPSYDAGPPPSGVPMALPAPTFPAPTTEPMPSPMAADPFAP